MLHGKLLGQLPTTPGSKNSAPEVKYPRDVIQLGGGRGYIFRLALELDAHDADHANNNFSGELKEDDGIVLTHVGTTKLKLAVPQ